MAQRRTASERLLDIREAIAKIDRFLAGRNYSDFTADAMLHDAVVRNIALVSEASRILPDEVKTLEPAIPWRNVADMGNWLRHGYDVVSDEILWETITRDLPDLRLAVDRLLAALR